jgi:maleylpyruvate isomerase
VLLHGFFRSGASHRVRIALNLKGLAYESRTYVLREGEQRSAAYLALNPEGLVPALELSDGVVLTQSLAICEYLDEIHPEPPLLPRDPVRRAQVRAFAQAIACDVHPVQNLKVLRRVEALTGSEEASVAWARETIQAGLDVCEQRAAREEGPFCFGDAVTLADICLIPQLGNARRFGAELRWPRLLAVEAACDALEVFQRAAPRNQPDAA